MAVVSRAAAAAVVKAAAAAVATVSGLDKMTRVKVTKMAVLTAPATPYNINICPKKLLNFEAAHAVTRQRGWTTERFSFDTQAPKR